MALVLRPGNGSPELLLIRRALLEGDPWSGHMALPGGRMEAGDPSLLHTARRETHEEVALALEAEGRILGRLGLVAPESPHLPRLTVVPFVFSVSAQATARAASHEVAEVVWTPLSHFQSRENRSRHHLELGGARMGFPAFDVGGRTVWGLTHRILEDFLSRLG